MKRKLTLCMILLFVPLLLLLSYLISQQSFALSMEQETRRAQMLETVIRTAIKGSVEGQPFDALQQIATQYESLYGTQQIELILLYNGYAMDGSPLPNQNYKSLLTGVRSAMLDTRSSPEMYVIADPLTEMLTLLLLQDVSGLYALRSQMRQAFLLWGFGGGLAVAVLSVLIAGWFSRPIRQLTKAARQLSQGDGENIALPLSRKDELGELSQSFRDMRQAVQEREAALQAEAAKQRTLLEALAHEMRTPLCALLGNTRLLENAAVTARQKEDVLAHMVREIKRLTDMDEQLLKLVDLRHGEIDPKQVSILALLQETARRLQPQANGVLIQVQGADATLPGDEALLSLMADNLAVNALRASKPGQRILLQANPNGFSVVDEGVGMDTETLAKAFEPFYKGDQSRTRSAGGAGLGLSLCERVAALHGGRLQLRSSPGEGTAATFTTMLQPVGDSVTSIGVSCVQEVNHP